MPKTQEIIDRKEKLIAKNRKALHDFFVLQTIEVGIVLMGTEVKSLRQGKCSLQDAYALFPNPKSHELFMNNLHISHYEQGNIYNHEPKRQRKLLIKYREAVKLRNAVQEKGLTLIPLSIYFSGPFVKIELGLVKARKKYDKRELKKKKDADREIRKKMKI
jgi:SsrA-binding protein